MSSELTSNFEVAESPCEQLERLKMAQQGREEVMLSQQEVILKYAGKMNELRMVLHLVESKLKVHEPDYVETIKRAEFEELSLQRLRSLTNELAQCRRQNREQRVLLEGEKQLLGLELKKTQLGLEHKEKSLSLLRTQLSNEKAMAITNSLPQENVLQTPHLALEAQQLRQMNKVLQDERDTAQRHALELEDQLNRLRGELEQTRRGSAVEICVKQAGLEKILKMEDRRKSLNSSRVEDGKTEVSDYDSEVDFETDFQFRRSGSTLSRTPYRENQQATQSELFSLKQDLERLEEENSELKSFKQRIETAVPSEFHNDVESSISNTWTKLEELSQAKQDLTMEAEKLRAEKEELAKQLEAAIANDAKDNSNVEELLEIERERNGKLEKDVARLEKELKTQELWQEQSLEAERKKRAAAETNSLAKEGEIIETIRRQTQEHESVLDSMELGGATGGGAAKDQIERLNSHINFLLHELQNSQTENKRLRARHSFSSTKSKSFRRNEDWRKNSAHRRSSMHFTLNNFLKTASSNVPRENVSAHQFFQSWCASSHNVYQKSELLSVLRDSAFTQHEVLQRREVFYLVVEECFGNKAAEILKRKMLTVMSDLVAKQWISHSDLFKLAISEVAIQQIKLQPSKYALEGPAANETLFASLKLLLHLFSFDRNITSWKHEEASLLRLMNGLKVLYQIVRGGTAAYKEKNFIVALKFVGLLAESECHSEELLKFELDRSVLALCSRQSSLPVRRAAAESYALLLLDNEILSSLQGSTQIEILLSELLQSGDEALTQKLLDCFLNLSVSSAIKVKLNKSSLSEKLIEILSNSGGDRPTQGVVFQIIYNLSHDHTTKLKHFRLVAPHIAEFLGSANNQFVNLGLTLLRRLVNVSKQCTLKAKFEEEVMRPRLEVVRPLIQCVKTKNLENKALAAESLYRMCVDYPDALLRLLVREKLPELALKCYKFKITLKVMHWSAKLLLLFCDNGYLSKLLALDKEANYNMLQDFLLALEHENSPETKINAMLLLSHWASHLSGKIADRIRLQPLLQPLKAELSASSSSRGPSAIHSATASLKLLAQLVDTRLAPAMAEHGLLASVLEITRRRSLYCAVNSECKSLLMACLVVSFQSLTHQFLRRSLFGVFMEDFLADCAGLDILSKLRPFSNVGVNLQLQEAGKQLAEIWNALTTQLASPVMLGKLEQSPAVIENAVTLLKQAIAPQIPFRNALKKFLHALPVSELTLPERVKQQLHALN